MEQPTAKRSRRLNQMAEIQSETEKRKKIKQDVDEKKKETPIDVPKKIYAKKATKKQSNVKHDDNSSGHDDLSAEEYKTDVPKEAAGKEEVEATDGEEFESPSSGDEVSTDGDARDTKPKKAVGEIEPKEAIGKDKVKSTDEIEMNLNTKSVTDVKDKKKLVKETRYRCKNQKKTSTNVKPKIVAKKNKPKNKTAKSELKATKKQNNVKLDENFSDHDDLSAEPYMAAGKDEVADTDGKEFETQSSGDEVSTDAAEMLNVVNARGTKPKKAASKIELKKAVGKNEDKPTNENEMNMDTSDALVSTSKLIDAPKHSTAGKQKVKPTDEVSTDAEMLYVLKARGTKPKKAASKIELKKAVGKDEEKQTNENEMDTSDALPSTSKDAQHSNEENMFKIMSRIETKLDDLVRVRVNEKRMFALILLMPFDLVEDITEFNLDLGDVDLYLKFAKYFGSVGGNSDGKIVCNILHQIATPNLLSQFEWQVSSPKSFQALKNIVKVIHAAASEICSEKYDMTVCGEVIKNVLRNARGGAYKK